MFQVRGAGFGEHALLPLVQRGTVQPQRRYAIPATLPPVSPGHEAGLEILPVVLRKGLRCSSDSRIFRQEIHGALFESELFAKTIDAFHAVLPLVPHKSEEKVACAGRERALSFVFVGRGL